MSSHTNNIANKSLNSKYPDASSGKSQVQQKYVSKLKVLDPNSKESVIEFIKMDVQNYLHASKKLKKDEEIIHLVCELDPTMYGIMTDKAKKIAEKYLSENPKLKEWGLI